MSNYIYHRKKGFELVMKKSRILQFERNNNNKEKARQILRNGILDMSVERLVQMTRYGLCGNISTMAGICGTTHYFNRMCYIKAENNEEQNLIEYSFVSDNKDDVIASTSICVAEIEEISGCVSEDHPDDVLDINVSLTDGTEITISVIY